ncbi:uncharacterized [Tachysurus ichikawai]
MSAKWLLRKPSEVHMTQRYGHLSRSKPHPLVCDLQNPLLIGTAEASSHISTKEFDFMPIDQQASGRV